LEIRPPEQAAIAMTLDRILFRAFVAVGSLAACAALSGNDTATYEAGEMVVTATRTQKAILDIPAAVLIMDRVALRSGSAISVDELFKTVPGVDLQGSGFPGSAIKLNMRGLTPGYQSKRILVLVDGRRINDQYQGNVEFALLPADSIERIEVFRGPASALYGSNAMGGVINIITRRGTKIPVTGVKVTGGSHDTWHTRLMHGYKTDKLEYFVSGSWVDTAGYMDNSDGTDRDWTAYNVIGNAGVQLGTDSELRMYLGTYGGRGTDESSDRKARKDFEHLSYSLKWDEERDARLTVRLYRNGDEHEYDWKYPGSGLYKQYTLGSEIQQSLWVSDRNLVTLGVDGRRESVDINEVTGRIDKHTSVAGFYAQNEIYLTDFLQITTGLRDDYNNDYGSEWSPRVGLLWRAGEDTDVFSSVNRAHRAPGLSDRFVRTEFEGNLFEGNPDLEPETLTAYEIGVRQRLASRAAAELTMFHNDMKDSFDFMLDEDGVFRIRNVTRVVTRGVESLLRYRIADELTGFLSYSFTDGSYEDFPADPRVEGNRLAYLASDKVGFGVDYARGSGLLCALHGRHVGPRYGDARNTSENRMHSYVVLDWRTRVPVSEYAQLIVNVDNLLDKTYRDFPTHDMPGRTFMAGAEVSF